MNTTLTVKKSADTGYIPVMYRVVAMTPAATLATTYCTIEVVRIGWDTQPHYAAWASHKDYYTNAAGAGQVSTMTVSAADVGGNTNGKYFNLPTPTVIYYIWFSNGSGIDPAPAGKVGIKIPFVNNDTAATIATNIKTALDALLGGSVFSTVRNTAQLTFTNLQVGKAAPTTDGTTGYTPFTPVTSGYSASASYNPLGSINPPQGDYSRLQGREDYSNTPPLGQAGTLGAIEIQALSTLVVYELPSETPSFDS